MQSSLLKMQTDEQVVNQVHVAKTTPINLINFYKTLKCDKKIYLHRPRMIRIRINNLTIIMFANGKVRFMGKPKEEFELELIFTSVTNLIATHIRLITETVSMNIGKKINVFTIAQQYPTLCSLESELFPALHIIHFKTVHVNVFAQGKVIILGKQAQSMLPSIKDFICTYMIQ